MKRILLTQGQEALVDDEDYEKLMQRNWQAHYDRTTKGWYARSDNDTDLVWMHNVIMKPPWGFVIDHVDHNGLNNQKYNMRYATPGQNAANKRAYSNNTTGFRGVSFRRGRYNAYVRHDGIAHYAGEFNTAKEAAKARDILAVELHGEFAQLNFPEDWEE